MNPLSDEEIAVQVSKGDRELFGLLVERYEAKITRYARKFLPNRQDIEDLVQQVFLKAYVNIKSFDPTLRFSPWLYRIAHNEFINALKKRSRESLSYFDFDLDAVLPHPFARETAEASAQDRELKNALNKSLEKVDAKYREPLVLYYIEELDYREIADILQIPVSTVGVRLSRGKTILKNIVDKSRISYVK